MNTEQQQAYDWAKNQNYQSIAARYARTLTTAVDDLQSQLAAERVKFAELQRYNVDCTKQFGMLQMDKVNLQNLLTESQRRERAAEELIAEVEKMINSGAEWFDAGAGEWGDAMERYRGEPGEEHRFKMSMHIRDAYRVGVERFDLAGAKIDRWRGPQEAGKGEAE